jgi:hypothetical protein
MFAFASCQTVFTGLLYVRLSYRLPGSKFLELFVIFSAPPTRGERHNYDQMKTIVELTPENAATLTWAMQLTGLPADELINFFLVDCFQNIDPEDDESFTRQTIGLPKFKTREDAARVIDWVKASVRKEHQGKLPAIESEIREVDDGRFEINVFTNWKGSETHRVC